MSIEPGWPVAVALAALLLVALAAHTIGGYGMRRPVLVAVARSLLQLAVVALVITAVVGSLVLSWVFVAVMLGAAVLTTATRVEAPRAAAWAGLAIASGVAPVLAIVLLSGAVPAEGIALVPVAGIVIGGAMSAHTLAGRRAFAALRDERAQYEAALSLGLLPADAIALVVHRRSPEALYPGLDQVRTTGLVTLPGAFVGVMLGGGTPVQAATTQVLVLLGILVAQTVTVVVAERLVAARRLLPPDLRAGLGD